MAITPTPGRNSSGRYWTRTSDPYLVTTNLIASPKSMETLWAIDGFGSIVPRFPAVSIRLKQSHFVAV
jgi:hypothetical protein